MFSLKNGKAVKK